MARPWSRKKHERNEPTSPGKEPAESVRLDGDDHAWWAQTEADTAWKPRERKRKEPDERDILAEHFGADWRTNFLHAPPTDEELEDQNRREQQAIADQDPYKVLHITEDATWDEIVAAHRHQARVHHPDRLFGQSEEEKAESEDRIRVINAAYQELRVRRGM